MSEDRDKDFEAAQKKAEKVGPGWDIFSIGDENEPVVRAERRGSENHEQASTTLDGLLDEIKSTEKRLSGEEQAAEDENEPPQPALGTKGAPRSVDDLRDPMGDENISDEERHDKAGETPAISSPDIGDDEEDHFVPPAKTGDEPTETTEEYKKGRDKPHAPK